MFVSMRVVLASVVGLILLSEVGVSAVRTLTRTTNSSSREENCLEKMKNEDPNVMHVCGKVPKEAIEGWLDSCKLVGDQNKNAGAFQLSFAPKPFFSFGPAPSPAPKLPENLQSVTDCLQKSGMQQFVLDRYTMRASMPAMANVRPVWVDGELDKATADTELENVLSTLTGGPKKKVTIVYPSYKSAEQLCLYAHAAVQTTCFTSVDGWFDVLAHYDSWGLVAKKIARRQF